MRLPLALALLLPLIAAPTPTGAHTDSGDGGGGYALDGIAREIAPRGRLPCADDLVRYRGVHVRYHKPLLVNPALLPRLERFERILVETSIDHYGRAPRRVRHIGAYNCRRIRRIPGLLSEHALGNAIDIERFEFPRAPRAIRAELPRAQRRAFRVSVERHWDAKGRRAAHSAFLRDLTDRMVAEDLFRVMLGPAFPGHDDHFHFDMAPYRLIAL